MRLLTILTAASLLAGLNGTWAEESKSPAETPSTSEGKQEDKEPFKVLPFSGQCHVLGKRNKFYFGTPGGFTAQLDPKSKKIYVTKPGTTTVITIEISEQAPVASQAVRKQLLIGDHPGSEVVEQSEILAVGEVTPMYELRWSKGAGKMGAQAVLSSANNCPVTFELVGPVQDGEMDAGCRDIFRKVLMSFKGGDLNGPTLSPPPITPE